MTNPHIKSANVRLKRDDGTFFLEQEMEFGPGLNIISGENGTGKTLVLRYLSREIATVIAADEPRPAITAFGPKRNTTKQSADAILDSIRQARLLPATIDKELSSSQIQDTSFSTHRSFIEIFAVRVEDQVRDGDCTYKDAVASVHQEFDQVLRRIFPGYSLDAVWKDRKPQIAIKKAGVALPIHRMSCGESEVLSLIFNIFVSKGTFDCFPHR